jgi:putative aldouronate transport system substrate-binding protein
MKIAKRALAIALCAALMAGACVGCKKTESTSSAGGNTNASDTSSKKSGELRTYKAFFAEPLSGPETKDTSAVKQKLNELTGATSSEEWLTGQEAEEAVGMLIAGNDYPDFIEGADATSQLIQAGALIELDDKIDKYPNIKNLFTKLQWAQIKQVHGHIYYIPQFSSFRNPNETIHNDEAFWIQCRVLKWANYPKITTMDQYFDLIERYLKENPKMKNGTPNIGYTILCDDWRYFCLENAPEFLDGYPNDGSVIVDPKEKKIIDYNTTPTAKLYFQKLNEEYKKGIIDKESFTQKYDQYISKLSTGAVLGMIDQWWDFANSVNPSINTQKLYEEGCDYVPLPVTIKDGVKNQWHTKDGSVLNTSSGLAITKDCKDVDGALQFVNDLLTDEAITLRNWGIKDKDYSVGADGLFARSDEQIKNCSNQTYISENLCPYSYFPTIGGMLADGKNAALPDRQQSLFEKTLNDDVKEVFKAYGAKNYCDMLGYNDKPGEWYPMYTYSNTLNSSTKDGLAWTKMGECKHKYLPQVVMAKDFESEWNKYMEAYNNCKPQDFLDAMQKELESRIKFAEENK